MNNNCTLIIFGATGDLARRYLIPALYTMIKADNGVQLCWVAVASSEATLESIVAAARDFITDPDEAIMNKLIASGVYYRLDANDPHAYAGLAPVVEHQEQTHGMPGNRLVYCSVPSSLYGSIADGVVQSGILTAQSENAERWHRIAFEKPFGHDLGSARELYASVSSDLNDDQIYIVDHYLGRELVANITMLRFTNRILEPMWNHQDIAHVNITLAESLDASMRTQVYEEMGALNDIVQNHLLQLLALIAMEQPPTLTGDNIQAAKASVLKNTQFDDGILGQYRGYREHEGVAPESTVETYARLRMFVHNDRWQGVPFYLTTGKCMPEKITKIEVVFKPADCVLTKSCPPPANKLIISIVPRAGFTFEINAKKVGVSDEVMPVDMEFCHECIYGMQTPKAYEMVLQEVILGMRSIAVSFPEIESSWRIIDAIKKAHLSVYEYDCGSQGPVEAKQVFVG